MDSLYYSVRLWIFIVVGLGFIAKSSSNGIKSFLNSDPLSKRTRFGLGYLHNHVWSKSWEILAEDLSFNGTSFISNQPVAGFMRVVLHIFFASKISYDLKVRTQNGLVMTESLLMTL